MKYNNNLCLDCEYLITFFHTLFVFYLAEKWAILYYKMDVL